MSVNAFKKRRAKRFHRWEFSTNRRLGMRDLLAAAVFDAMWGKNDLAIGLPGWAASSFT